MMVAVGVKPSASGSETTYVSAQATNSAFDSSSIESNNRYTGVTSINSQGIINKITFTKK